MNKNITLDDLKLFEEKYNKGFNQKIENKIKRVGLREAYLNKKNEYSFKFNIEVPDVKIYNQFSSHQCNIYAFLRVAKDLIRNNTNIDVNNLNLSANYINFFDRLEKINMLYNELIMCKNMNIEIINNCVNNHIVSCGTFHSCKEIVNKYGLVLTKDMEEVNSKYDENLVMELLKDKIKIDATHLIRLKVDDRLKLKSDLLYEAYQFLSKIYGNPPSSFNFDNKTITPIEFKNMYLNDYLNNFVTVTSLDEKELTDSYSYIPNMYLNDTEEIITLANNNIKKAIINQLKDGVSVWFSSELSTALDYENGILSDNAYDFNDLLNLSKISKQDKLKLDIINYDHAMCITGALIENDETIQYKVDNSFGDYGKYNGYLIMPATFLESGVITLIIDKKYI